MKINKNIKTFGKRLVELRRSKGLTQTELGKKVGASKRVVAYYENETNKIPADFLVPLSKALKVSLDELVGIKEVTVTDAEHAKLWRRLKKAEELSSKDRKTLFDFLDALIVRSKFKK